MADPIRIRAYQVGFGDAFLVTVRDGRTKRHMVVDFGNVAGRGGSNRNFERIAKDIRKETGGHLDVVVMTHEHLDHMEGYRHQRKIFDEMTVDWVWMSIPSHPNYYRDHPDAEPLRRIQALADRFARTVQAKGLMLAPSFRALLRNNLSNTDRIKYLKDLPQKDVLYLARGSSVYRKPFSRLKIRILAPEEDMSVYYGGKHGARNLAGLARSFGADGNGAGSPTDDDSGLPPALRKAFTVTYPDNLSKTEWHRLRETIQSGGVQAVRTIDKAKNNTSLVFLMEVDGKRLLFSGDAELESWEMLAKKNRRHMKPVDFLKVSHHGSHNGTPLDLLDTLLPKRRKGKAKILVSTQSRVYGTKNPVPDASLIKELKKRGAVTTTDGMDDPWNDVEV